MIISPLWTSFAWIDETIKINREKQYLKLNVSIENNHSNIIKIRKLNKILHRIKIEQGKIGES